MKSPRERLTIFTIVDILKVEGNIPVTPRAMERALKVSLFAAAFLLDERIPAQTSLAA